MKFSRTHTLAFGLLLSAPLVAQNPPALPSSSSRAPAPPPGLVAPPSEPDATSLGSPSTKSSRIQAIDYGPDGLVQSLFLRDGVVVHVSPDLGRQLAANARKGTRLTVSGPIHRVGGQAIADARSITVGGQTMVAQLGPGGLTSAPVGAPPPPPGKDRGLGPDLGRARRGRPGPPPPPDGLRAGMGPGPDGPPPPLPAPGIPRTPRPFAGADAPPPADTPTPGAPSARPQTPAAPAPQR
jgi:hypothetical protein